ncbi:MAG: helix-turn-helix domain-containing protein [Nocardioides sp.]
MGKLADSPSSASDLLSEGLQALAMILEGYDLTPYTSSVPSGRPEATTTPVVAATDATPAADAVVTVVDQATQTGSGPVLVRAEEILTPARVESPLVPIVELIRRINGHAEVVVVSRWLSPRVRQTLESHGYNYLDLTGNVAIRLPRPVTKIRLEGARTDPGRTEPAPRARGLGGARAGRLVRALVDVPPPYSATELARATDLSIGYVSRLLDTLQGQGLVNRTTRAVQEVDWVGVLRERVQARRSSLATQHGARRFVAPGGTAGVLVAIAERRPDEGEELAEVAITGGVAANAIRPTVVGGDLTLYVRPDVDLGRLGDQLGLLPASTAGSDVTLLPAPDPVVFRATRDLDGVPRVADSQVVLDCLAGPGRLPAAGEAVLESMQQDEQGHQRATGRKVGVAGWRTPTLKDWAASRRTASRRTASR